MYRVSSAAQCRRGGGLVEAAVVGSPRSFANLAAALRMYTTTPEAAWMFHQPSSISCRFEMKLHLKIKLVQNFWWPYELIPLLFHTMSSTDLVLMYKEAHLWCYTFRQRMLLSVLFKAGEMSLQLHNLAQGSGAYLECKDSQNEGIAGVIRQNVASLDRDPSNPCCQPEA